MVAEVVAMTRPVCMSANNKMISTYINNTFGSVEMCCSLIEKVFLYF